MRKGGGTMKKGEINKMVEMHEQALQEMGGFLNNFSATVLGDLNKLNMIVVALLREQNKIIDYECECGFTTLIPKLKHVEIDTHCPQCGKEYLTDSQQTKVEDWDNAKVTKEEE